LPVEFYDNALTDNFSGYREFHLSGDVVVKYKPSMARVTLMDAGGHAAMFGHRKHKRKGRLCILHPFDAEIDRAMADAARALKKLWRRDRLK